MISKSEKKALNKIFGKHYTSNVIEVLEARGVTDTSGKTHSAQMVREVFNGNREHIEIESAILEAANLEVKRQKQLKRIKSRILKSA